ncbi:energy-coupling factor transporter ATPase [Aminipila butyrica]|uniref:Energy-coupling factor transporter ATP-binding protein EcfA2 n=1 Tax=Aminipila butyrica TaxID=433296 RepID=A0A858BWJ5_9FIRM|nr:energy-coupling factor transporter ATPase [Aminipila butyrica]QIB68456.1 energy-coupling factor transporter ATPase [Aminipila butyrica]
MSIQIRNLKHVYSEGLPFESVALDDVSFEIGDGEIVGIIGHTGSGKSTLIQHLNGLLKPKSGQILVGDVDITGPGVSMKDIRRRIGLVFQYPEYQLFEETVKLDVAFGPLNLGLSREEAEARAKEAISLVGLDYEEIGERSPFDLSGGQKRRVAIAGVIAMKPEVLILDEPTAGLDPSSHRELLAVIQRIYREQGGILILVSHNMRDIANLADRVLVMDKGRLAMSGTPREVFARRAELTDMGLSVPPAAEILYQLQERGFPIDPEVLNMEEAVEELMRRL